MKNGLLTILLLLSSQAALADLAYCGLVGSNNNQYVIINGEYQTKVIPIENEAKVLRELKALSGTFACVVGNLNRYESEPTLNVRQVFKGYQPSN
ncbi:MAG: hypothetical protein AB7O96_17900 [Pseudobdellovibrionaceae bacterium]